MLVNRNFSIRQVFRTLIFDRCNLKPSSSLIFEQYSYLNIQANRLFSSDGPKVNMEKGMSQFSDKKPTKHKYKTLSKYLINSSNRRFHLRVSEHKEHKKITLGISEYNLENQESKLLGVHNLDAVQTIRNVFDVMVKKMEEHKAKELEEPEPEIRKERRIINLYREQFSDKIGNLIFNYTISLRTSNDGGYFIELILETTKLFSQAKAAKNEHKQVKLYIKGNILQEFRDTLTEILNIYNDVNVQKHLSKVDFYQPTIAKKAAKESIKEQSFYFESENARITVKLIIDKNSNSWSLSISERDLSNKKQNAIWINSRESAEAIINSMNTIFQKINQVKDTDILSEFKPQETLYSESFYESFMEFNTSLIYLGHSPNKDGPAIHRFSFHILKQYKNNMQAKISIPYEILPQVRDYLVELLN